MRTKLVCLAVLLSGPSTISRLFPPLLHGADCNQNGIEDDLDVQPGPPMLDAARSFPVGNIRFVVAADLDTDGELDCFTAIDSKALVFLNLGNATFNLAPSLALELPGEIHRGAAGDLNGDQLPDLALLHSTGMINIGGISILCQNFNAQNPLGFQPGAPPLTVSFDRNAGPNGLLLANMDAMPELDIAFNSSGAVTLFPNVGGCSFGPPTSVTTPNSSLTVADIDGQNGNDLLVGGGDKVFLNKGDLSFNASDLDTRLPRLTTTSDVNGDGLPDVVGADAFQIVVLLNQANPGNSPFSPASRFTADAETTINAIVTADINNDMRPDVLRGR